MLNLPTLAEFNAKPRACPKGKTRLQEHIEARPMVKVNEKDFKTAVWLRDKSKCRCCGRKVIKTMSRVPERGEVNHIHGRGKDLRFEVKAGILMCLQCHEKFTGRVGEKWILIATATFQMREHTYTDATFPVRFERVV
jgi:hypothetical protein